MPFHSRYVLVNVATRNFFSGEMQFIPNLSHIFLDNSIVTTSYIRGMELIIKYLVQYNLLGR
jgi:hypothetical protein